MQYREDKYKRQISILGYGCMRFTRKGGIDIDKAEKELMAAIEGGVNYLDTAYIYPGSEAAVGEILKRNHCRDKVYIATKLPQYLIKAEGSMDKYFTEQLRRLQTEYIDYYLMHMLTDIAAWEKLCRLGIKEWIQRKKKAFGISDFPFMVMRKCFCRFLRLMIGISVRFCIIIWMNTVRRAGKDFRQRRRREFP